ncbi:hypothetical protein GCT13_08340 [Paraburkholderia sp. CNPSo 3157]|uniref:Uncharacterized protein n=1 Tax=Paraburkholderia franconis TaxID=2654983 RepID=A0A7X1N7Z9_9BURK|nr:hypothetical protein [Paraburkholderia franconis]MPW16939.1 hypothetical protein [Paraburkholderia franconis]
MNRIAILGASLLAGVGASLGRSLGDSRVVTLSDDRPRASALRRFVSRKQSKVSNRMPHIGAKEQERAQRFYMVDTHPSGVKRSAPTIQQMSKRQYEAQLAKKAA